MHARAILSGILGVCCCLGLFAQNTAQIAYTTPAQELLVQNGDKLLLIGDSIMAYGGLNGYHPLFRMACKELGVEFSDYVCNGAGGRRMFHLLNEKSDCYLPKLVNGKGFKYVFIEIGVNDQNAKRTWEEYAADLEAAFKIITDAGAKLVLIGNCQNNSAGPVSGWCAKQREFCASHQPKILFCDCAKFETAAYAKDKIKNSGDGIHPNYYGYRWMALAMLEAMGLREADHAAAIAQFDAYYKSVMFFSVDFLDWDRRVIGEAQSIHREACAKAPEEPKREGHTFVGWSPDGGKTLMSAAEIGLRKVYGPVAYTAMYRSGTRVRDTAATTYTWKGEAAGAWTDKSKWDMAASGVVGYPDHETYATAEFAAGATVDLGGETIGLKALALPKGNRGAVTFKNGALRLVNGKNLLHPAKHLALDNCHFYALGDQPLDPGTDGSSTVDLKNGAFLDVYWSSWNFNKGARQTFNIGAGENQIRQVFFRYIHGTINVTDGCLAIAPKGLIFESGTLDVNLNNGSVSLEKMHMGKGKLRLTATLAAQPKALLACANALDLTKCEELTLRVDAAKVSAPGTYPLFSAPQLKLPKSGVSLEVTAIASGRTARLETTAQALKLVVE